MKPHKEQALRCAIYTRKSSEEGLERTSIRCTPSARPVKRSTLAQIADLHFRQTEGERHDPPVPHAYGTAASETARDGDAAHHRRRLGFSAED
jgi:hypothetical protein